MNIESFVAEGREHDRGRVLLLELREQQRDKPEEKDCTGLIHTHLFTSVGNYWGKTFVEARDSSGKLCGVSIYTEDPDMFYVDFLCSDCAGTGTRILDYISAKASAAGHSKIGLGSVPRSVGFYRKVGFETPPGEKGMYMEKSLVPKPAGPRPAPPVELPGGRRKTYRRRKSRKHGSTSLRRHKARRVLSR
jgi:hypothetical protein